MGGYYRKPRPRPHQHKNRRQDRSVHQPGGASNQLCPGIAYQSSQAAKRAEHVAHPHRRPTAGQPQRLTERNRAYACDRCGLWHVEPVPDMVIQGVVTAGEWFGTAGRPPMRDVLIPLLYQLAAHTGGTPTFARRTGVDDTDLWAVMVDSDRGTFVARDYDSPAEAAAAVLAEYDTERAPA
jgi:hypothetical protein